MKNTRTGDALPTVTVVIATCNSGRTIDACLKSIRDQEYPEETIDVICADGGSTDRTREIALRFGANIISIPKERQNAEYNKGVGVRAATGEFLLLIDHDNVLPHPLWLRRMTQPLLDDPNVVAVQPLRFHYDRRLSPLDRYGALFGCLDPVVYALGKSDHLPWHGEDRIRFGRATDCGSYYQVEMDPERIPTLGANGCLIRRALLSHTAFAEDGPYLHIDVHVDLIRQGYTTYAFTKDTILHLTGYNNLRHFLWRRKLFFKQFIVEAGTVRRYRTYRGAADAPRLAVFILSAITVLPPALQALRGYRAMRDPAWFLHPVLAFTMLWLYAYVLVASTVKNAVWELRH